MVLFLNITRIHGYRNQGVEVRVAPRIITPSDPLAEFLLLVPITLGSADLEVLAPKRRMFSPMDTMIPLNWKLGPPPSGHFVNQQAEKGNYY